MNRGPAFQLDPADAAVVADYIRDLRRREVRPATLFHYERNLSRFGGFIAPTPLLAATEDDITRWMDGHLERGLALESRCTYFVAVRRFFAWAAKRRLVEVDPAADIAGPKRKPGTPRPISEADLRLALMTAGPPVRVWMVLAAFCGLRAGEIARLRREHVREDLQPPLLHVVNGKGGRQRLIPLSRAVLAELSFYLSGRRGGLWRADGRTTRPDLVTQKVGRHLQSLGIPHSCHSLRHRFATDTYRRSRDVLLTGRLLGHASPTTTAIYADHDQGLALETVAMGSDLLREAPPVLIQRRRGGAW